MTSSSASRTSSSVTAVASSGMPRMLEIEAPGPLPHRDRVDRDAVEGEALAWPGAFVVDMDRGGPLRRRSRLERVGAAGSEEVDAGCAGVGRVPALVGHHTVDQQGHVEIRAAGARLRLGEAELPEEDVDLVCRLLLEKKKFWHRSQRTNTINKYFVLLCLLKR